MYLFLSRVGKRAAESLRKLEKIFKYIREKLRERNNIENDILNKQIEGTGV